MKKINYILTILSISLILACSNTTKSQQEAVSVENNTLTEKEVADGWKLLFDGKTSDGWRGYKKETFPTSRRFSLSRDVSTPTTECPRSAKHEAVVSPTQPQPTTVI